MVATGVESKRSAQDVEVVDRGGYRMALRPVAIGWRSAVVDETASWLREKGVDLDLTRDVRIVGDGRTIRAMHHRNGGAEAFLLSMSETNDGGTFVTTVLAVDDPDDPWLMLRVTSDRRRAVPAPRLARRLLERIDLHDGDHPLTAQSQLVHPGTLAGFTARLTDPTRRGVVLAVGTGDLITPAIITPKLDSWVRNTVGLAATLVLTPEATTKFSQTAGAYRAHEGTIRTYGRGVDLDAQSIARTHRMLSPRTVTDSEDWQVRNLLTTFTRAPLGALPLPATLARWDRTFERLLNREMTSRIIVPRPARSVHGVAQGTAELERIRATLGIPDLAEETLLRLVEASTAPSVDQSAVDAIDRRIQALQQERETLEDELSTSKEAEWQAREDAVEADERASESQLILRKFQRLLHKRGLDPWALANDANELAPDAPTNPGSWSDLVERAGEWEEFGVHITAEERPMLEMDTLDSDGRALAAAYEALSALAGYVQARRCGAHDQDFGRYLEVQPAGYATYPRSRFAPTETNWTKQRHGHERELPVPMWLHASGTTTMHAHLRLTKISNKDPRVYLLDATDPQGQFVVVVGYIGQHLTNRATAGMN